MLSLFLNPVAFIEVLIIKLCKDEVSIKIVINLNKIIIGFIEIMYNGRLK